MGRSVDISEDHVGAIFANYEEVSAVTSKSSIATGRLCVTGDHDSPELW